MADLIINKSNVTKLFSEYLEKHKSKWVFMMEIPEDKYFEVNLETVKGLTEKGYSGIYISLHRPYNNLVSLLKQKGINTAKLSFIDAASSQGEHQGADTKQCTYISKDLNVDELTRVVYKILPLLKGKSKFVFLDSVTTLTLYQPLSEALRFAEFLSRTVKKGEVNGVVMNVASNLAKKKFIRDVIANVDEVIKVGGK